MAMLRGVDLHMDMANGELTIHLPNGSTIAFAARRTSAMWIIALEQHDVQQASGNMYHHAGTQPPSHKVIHGIA